MPIEQPLSRQREWKQLGSAARTGIGTDVVYALPSTPAGLTAMIMTIHLDLEVAPTGLVEIYFHPTDISTALAGAAAADRLATYPAGAGISNNPFTEQFIGITQPGGGIGIRATDAADQYIIHVFGYEEYPANA